VNNGFSGDRGSAGERTEAILFIMAALHCSIAFYGFALPKGMSCGKADRP
jgi:hypothetical protein